MSLLPAPNTGARARTPLYQTGYGATTRSGILHSLGTFVMIIINTRRRTLPFAMLAALLLLLLFAHSDDAVSVHLRDLGYATRPLWEKPPERFKNVLRLSNDESLWRELDDDISSSSSSSISLTESYDKVCKAHNLQTLLGKNNNDKQQGEEQKIPRVYDVVLFSVELDLLEIRIRELFDIVDYFVIVESNVTFSGDLKPFTFQNNQDQFDFAKEKIIYRTVTDLDSSSSSSASTSNKQNKENEKQDPFKNEVKMRIGVSKIIDSLTPFKGDIILQSDVDEIPSSRAVSLLKYCSGYPDIIHLGMPSYLYSFEFPMERQSGNAMNVNNGEGAGPRQWRASAKKYGTPSYNGYSHSRQSDTILEKAGWHLTFAFKYIDDFIFKMKSYSHNDRVTSPSQLSPDVIQEKICTGADIYDMLPEAYDFQSLISQWGKIPSSTNTRNIPKSVLEYKDRFGYLLPGGCKRQLRQTSQET